MISVVVPLFNEKENLPETWEGLSRVLEEMGEPWEILFVDDGSTDGSFEFLKRLHEENPDRVRVLRFIRNFGKTAALNAAFRRARGEVILTIDADLQEDPTHIREFLHKIREEGYHLVSGWRKKRRDPPSKTIPSRLFNFVVRTMTGVPLHDFNCGFKAYRREVVENVRLYGEFHRFIPVLAAWKGFRVTEIPVHHRPRLRGKSKFGWKRMIHGYIDFVSVYLLTRFLKRPMHLFGGVGSLFFLVGVAINAFLSFEKIVFQKGLGHRPLLLLGVLLTLSGLQLLVLGLLGEMLRYHHFDPQDEFVIEQELL